MRCVSLSLEKYACFCAMEPGRRIISLLHHYFELDMKVSTDMDNFRIRKYCKNECNRQQTCTSWNFA
jgi:hypothetical protein